MTSAHTASRLSGTSRRLGGRCDKAPHACDQIDRVEGLRKIRVRAGVVRRCFGADREIKDLHARNERAQCLDADALFRQRQLRVHDDHVDTDPRRRVRAARLITSNPSSVRIHAMSRLRWSSPWMFRIVVKVWLPIGLGYPS